MNYFLKELSNEQRCAFMGLAIELCGCKSPSSTQLSKLDFVLQDFSDELGISKDEVESFTRKMENNGRLKYAVDILKTIENNKLFGTVYPHLYSIVATLESVDGLNLLNKIYKDEFGYQEDDILLLWDLFEIKDFRKASSFVANNNTSVNSREPRTVSSTNASGNGCLVLLLVIPVSLLACFCCIAYIL